MSLESVVDEFPLFNERQEKERFLLILGLLASRTVTLAKAAEVMGMSRLEFSALLRTIGFKYSYLDEAEAKKEVSEKIIEAPEITPEEYKRYRGKDVAIYKGKIIADGRTSTEALKKALRKCPEAKTEEVEIFYIHNSDDLMIL